MRDRSRCVAATTRVSTLHRAIGADRLHGLRLEHAQELRLRRERQLAELVEEQRAAARLDERALAIAVGAGERAADVAEQVRVDQVLGDRAAIDDDERALRARVDASWIARAASSLPVPDSPSISTVASVGDAISSTANSSRIATLLPAIAPK